MITLLQLIPVFAAGCMEDGELIDRDGEKHMMYIEQTAILACCYLNPDDR